MSQKEQGPGQVQTPNDAAERRAAHVAALEFEREGYERRGLKERAAQVDAELEKFGGAPKKRTPPKPEKG